jgi:hypothetical protein
VIVAGCSSILGETPVDPSPGGTNTSSGRATTTESSEVSCIRFTGDHSTDVNTGTLAGDALYLSGEIFLCADDVIVVGEGNLNEIAAASQLAAALSGPLLFPHARLGAELGRLKPERVHLVGSPTVKVPTGADTVTHDVRSAMELTQVSLGAGREVALPAVADASTVVETVLAIDEADRVAVPGMPTTTSTATSTTATPETEIAASELVTGLVQPSDSEILWLVDAAKPKTILLASALGKSLSSSVLAIDADDVLGYPAVGDALDGRSGETTRFIGGTPQAAEWELAVLANGQQIPGGGYHILPGDRLRRYVAFYGHPGTDDLGVLGEQGPAETRSRMQDFVDAYGGDGAQVIPTYEIIVSVASAGAGEDNDYSTEWPPETFDDWIAYARDNGMYVLLDLQPGREDFLSQAMLYEDLLELPFVGLALDPEWRLKPDEVHLVQTGTVDGAEINQVVTWLADLVRDNGLPQKMLLLHQFRASMITNRDLVMERPELQVVVQMDGDGTEAQKNATWSNLKEGADDAHWSWGWKNFFDEDEPGPPTPESTMSKVPTPVYVSYQ